MSSEITGTLPADKEKRFGSIIKELLPAGSISGAPKEATIEAIREAEGQQRGFYTGVFGYFDGSSFDSAVMIRYIEQLPDGQYLFRSDSGITIKITMTDLCLERLLIVFIIMASLSISILLVASSKI